MALLLAPAAAGPAAEAVPWISAPDLPGASPCDFFLFIKDYSWSLRYRVSLLSEEGLDMERPLQLEWVRLRRPVSSPEELFEGSSADLFDWAVREPPRHEGFAYQVIEVVGSGVEAVINFFKGRGPNLLVQPDGISLASKRTQDGGEPAESTEAADEQCHVTHCWVECWGLPFIPIVQSVAFFNLRDVVMDWRA